MEKTFKRSFSELKGIVAVTAEFFEASRIDPSIRTHVDLSIEELFVNMVKYNKETQRDILLQMSRSGNGVEVSLTDYDVEPFDPTHPPAVDINAPLEQRTPNGLGLFLVSKMVDSIHYQYRNRESKITFIKRVEGSHA
jgi:serine/threonine-protein kinase RsbW